MKQTTTGLWVAAGLVLLGGALTLRDLSGAPQSPVRRPGADFVVRSARDAGPGTLREAILAADRLTSRAHIELAVERIAVDSALPALTNLHGVDIEARPGSGTIDARNQANGVALQISSPGSSVQGLHIVNARGTGLMVNAAGVELGSVAVSDSGVGLLLAATAQGCTVRAASFDHDETAVLAEPGIQDVTLTDSTFSGNTHAAFWFVSAAGKSGAAQPSGADGLPERAHVRIIASTFTQNASGVVLANQATLIQKSHFTANRDSAVLVLGGAVRIEDTDISSTGGTAISITSGRAVQLLHNTLANNTATAIMARDSEVTIEHNALQHNGTGIVAIDTGDGITTVVRDNTVTQSTGDALVVIGGPTLLERNQVLQNHGVALRVLDLVTGSRRIKATPRLDGNVFKGNAVDTPVSGVYKQAAPP
jgi:Right handed beta helix region